MAEKAVTLGTSTFCPPPKRKIKKVAPKGGKNLDFYNLNQSIKNPNKENMSITVYPDFQFVQSQDYEPLLQQVNGYRLFQELLPS